jgi:hypothetical protein
MNWKRFGGKRQRLDRDAILEELKKAATILVGIACAKALIPEGSK